LVPLTRQITPIADLKALWILFIKLKRIKPDIVHTHTPKAGLIGMMAAWLARVPVRLHTVAGLPLESTAGNKRKLLLFIERLTYWCAHEVWPNSYSLRSFIETNNLTKSEKLHVIGKGSSNGIDVTEFTIDALDNSILDEIKDTIKYDPSFKYLLFVGRVVRDKGIEELVDVFTKLSKVDDSLRLILVGPMETDLDPLSKATLSKIENNTSIILTGFSDEVKYYMSLADLFVFPSHREGFPNVPMQSGLMNCPVIASRINGMVDIIDHDVHGLLHEKGNVEDLYAKLDFALNNPKHMVLLAANLKNKIISNFDRKVMHDLILKRYFEHLPKLTE